MNDKKITEWVHKLGKTRAYFLGNLCLALGFFVFIFFFLKNPEVNLIKTVQYSFGNSLALLLAANLFLIIRTELYYSSHKKSWWYDKDKFMSVIYGLYLLAITALIAGAYFAVKWTS